MALRRELKVWEGVALSLGIMGPTIAMALDGTAPAGEIGTKVPLAFLLALIGIALVGYGFVRLSRYISHAGSVYALVGVTLGPRTGFVGGWALWGFYFVSVAASSAATALFGVAFLNSVGVHGNIPWLPLALLSVALCWIVNSRKIKIAARSLLAIEVISVTLVVILCLVIFARVLNGSAPHGQKFTISPFLPGGGITFGAIMAASIFGFLAFAGFEGTAALGEETGNPKRDIPRALIYAIVLTGILYVLSMFAETLGFGATNAGAAHFAGSAAPLDVLAKEFVGSGLATALSLGATLSAFASAVGATTGASRLMFAYSRDGWGPRAFSETSAKHGEPTNALTAVVIGAAALLVIVYLTVTTSPVNEFFYIGTTGVLMVIVVYAVASFGAFRFLFFSGVNRAPRWEMAVPLLGTAYLAYVLYKQFVPIPEFPYNVIPYFAIGWILFAVALTLVRPAQAKHMGEALTTEVSADSEVKAKA